MFSLRAIVDRAAITALSLGRAGCHGLVGGVESRSERQPEPEAAGPAVKSGRRPMRAAAAAAAGLLGLLLRLTGRQSSAAAQAPSATSTAHTFGLSASADQELGVGSAYRVCCSRRRGCYSAALCCILFQHGWRESRERQQNSKMTASPLALG